VSRPRRRYAGLLFVVQPNEAVLILEGTHLDVFLVEC